MREILLVLTDTHGGSEVGLCNPETKLWDKGARPGRYRPPSLTNTQVLLWQDLERHLGQAKEIADGDPVTVAHLGDITNGGVFMSDVNESRFMGQYQIAKWNMYRIVEEFGEDQIKEMLILDGTNVHTYDGSSEYVLADLLREKYRFPVWCYPHKVHRIGETTHDLAHHGPSPGKKVWGKGNPGLSWLRNHMIRELMDGNKPDTCFYRGHWHEYVAPITHRETRFLKTGIETFESAFVYAPGYSGLSDHARKATQSESMITWGMIVVEILDGKSVRFNPLVQPHDTRIREGIE